MTGGQSITVTGSNFTNATSVSLGGQNATDVVVVSDSTITATTPVMTASALTTQTASLDTDDDFDEVAAAEEKQERFGPPSLQEGKEQLPSIQANAIVTDPGCSTYSLGRTDDWGANKRASLGFSANWFGTSYDTIQINNNGGVAFDDNSGSFSDYRGVVLESTNRPVVLPLFTDVDTRNTSTSPVTHGAITWDGSPAYCVTWASVGEYPRTGPKFSFQLLIVNRSSAVGRSSGDIDIVFNYNTVGTPTYNGNGKFVVGYADPVTRSNTNSIVSASDDPSMFVDGGAQALIAGSVGVAPSVPGRYLYEVSNDEADRSVDVSVTTPAGTGTKADAYIYSQERPVISNLSRTSGPTSGAVSVSITGRNFSTVSGTASVTFGGTRVTGLTVHSDTRIDVTIPAHAAGTVDVMVANASGSTTRQNFFTYGDTPAIIELSPITGPTNGNTVVSITGSNLWGASSVTFGESDAASFTVDSDSSITALSPPGSAGSVDVTVVAPGGSVTESNAFTYTVPAPPACSDAFGSEERITTPAEQREVIDAEPERNSPAEGLSEAFIVTVKSERALDRVQKKALRIGGDVEDVMSDAVKAIAVDLTERDAQDLANDPGVIAVESDAAVRIFSGEEQTDAPWGLDRVDQRSLPLSTTYLSDGDGCGVVVYIIDTGIRASHEDFAGRVASGYDAVDDDYAPDDCQGHGTHVAGTAVGAKYGVAKAATVVGVRVLDCWGSGYTSDVVAGMDWVRTNHSVNFPSRPGRRQHESWWWN